MRSEEQEQVRLLRAWIMRPELNVFVLAWLAWKEAGRLDWRHFVIKVDATTLWPL